MFDTGIFPLHCDNQDKHTTMIKCVHMCVPTGQNKCNAHFFLLKKTLNFTEICHKSYSVNFNLTGNSE